MFDSLKVARKSVGLSQGVLGAGLGIDVWTCHCGGHRRVRAIVTNRATAEAMLRSMSSRAAEHSLCFNGRSP